MTNIHLEIDGLSVEAKAGDSIAQAARRVGLGDRIPTLCEEPGHKHQTSCFVCVVEVEGLKGKLPPACSTAAADGMKIHTGSERVVASRKTALELLLSNHPADCVAPCVRGCPAHVDVQRYLALAGAGKYEEAVRTIRRQNPLVSICGRVCVRACEDGCRRTVIEDEAVGVNMVKRYLGDWEREHPMVDTPGAETGKRVAIVGGGPAGLTASYYLRLMGHGVDLFEAMPLLGGMLRYGIPDYRLPDEVLDHEIDNIVGLGVKVFTDQRLGRDISFDKLREDYDAVLVAVGAWNSMPGRVDGEDHPRVLSGIEFLRLVKEGLGPDFTGRRVAVVGGGNTAIDAARTALRTNAAAVDLLYRRTRAEMPADEEEIVGADNEGVDIKILTAPLRVEPGEGDEIRGVTCQRMELGEPDASGRRRPVPVAGSEHLVEADDIIMAIGQKVDLSGVEGRETPALTRWGSLDADEQTGATNLDGVFAAGDDVSGPSVAIAAIGMAHRAAKSLDQYLRGEEVHNVESRFDSMKEDYGEVRADMIPAPKVPERSHQPEIDGKTRARTWDEVESSISFDQLQDEVNRCLKCGCGAQDLCTLRGLAETYEVTHAFGGDANQTLMDTSNPRIQLEPNKCILCGRCITMCTEVMHVGALGFIGRGFETILQPTMGKPLVDSPCISCGSCVEACPSGAFTFSEPCDMVDPLHDLRSTCTLCGLGCEISVRDTSFGPSIRAPRNDQGVLQPICALGRFGNRALLGDERIKHPMIRDDSGELVQASWDEALTVAVAGMHKVRATMGTGPLMVSAGPGVSGEQALALKGFAETFGAIRTGSLTVSAGRSSGPGLERVRSSATFEDLAEAEAILWVGACSAVEETILVSRLREARRAGATIIVVSETRSRLARCSDLWLHTAPGDTSRVATALLTADSLGELRGPSPEVFGQAKRAFVGDRLVIGASAESNPELSEAKLDVLNSQRGEAGLLLSSANANVLGLAAAGIETEEVFALLFGTGAIEAAWLMGEDPMSCPGPEMAKPSFLVVQDLMMTKTASQADVVLPLSSSLEDGGTFLRSDGRILRLKPTTTRVVSRETVDVLREATKKSIAGAAPISEQAAKSLEGLRSTPHVTVSPASDIEGDGRVAFEEAAGIEGLERLAPVAAKPKGEARTAHGGHPALLAPASATMWKKLQGEKLF